MSFEEEQSSMRHNFMFAFIEVSSLESICSCPMPFDARHACVRMHPSNRHLIRSNRQSGVIRSDLHLIRMQPSSRHLIRSNRSVSRRPSVRAHHTYAYSAIHIRSARFTCPASTCNNQGVRNGLHPRPAGMFGYTSSKKK